MNCPKCMDLANPEKRHDKECRDRFRRLLQDDGLIEKPSETSTKDPDTEFILHALSEHDKENEVAIQWEEGNLYRSSGSGGSSDPLSVTEPGEDPTSLDPGVLFGDFEQEEIGPESAEPPVLDTLEDLSFLHGPDV